MSYNFECSDFLCSLKKNFSARSCKLGLLLNGISKMAAPLEKI